MAYPSDGISLYTLLQNWQEVGVYDILLPFLLVFTIAFAVLQKVKIFGTDAKKINVIVALVIAFLFLQNSYLIFILQRFLPNMSLIMIISLMFLLLVGIFGGTYETGLRRSALNIAFVFSLIVTIIALSVDFFPGATGYGLLDWFYSLPPTTQSLIILVIIVVVAIAVVTSEKKKPDEGFWAKLGQDLESSFTKKP